MREILERELSRTLPDFSGKELWIWGAGNTAALYFEGLQRLEREGFFISGYCDSDEQKWGGWINGCKVASPKELLEKENIYILICSIQPKVIKQISDNLEEMNLQFCLLDEVIMKVHKAEFLNCYDLFDDETSKRTYAQLLLNRLNRTYMMQEYCHGKQYFLDEVPSYVTTRGQEVFVDCGAYVGDTIEKFIWNTDGVLKKVIAFEPDEKNFAAMQKRVHRLIEEWNFSEDTFELYSYGVAEKKQTRTFWRDNHANGLGSKFVETGTADNVDCRIVSLDEQVSEEYTFLKADIESYEYKMLLGARDGIVKYQPKLAICIYHNIVDTYSIPLLIHSMVPEYKMAVRHYRPDVSETILYAWVE